MSFGLGVSFGRLCRLDRQRREAFGADNIIREIDLRSHVYVEYKECTPLANKNIIVKPFSLIDKKAVDQFITDEAIDYWY